MTRRVLFLIACAFLVSTTAFSQTEEELKAEKAEKAEQVKALQGQIDALNGEIAGIDAKLLEWPRWEKGAFGVLGMDFTGFNNWLSRDQANISSSSIGVTVNAYANYLAKKSFWRNAANLNMGWIKFDDRDDPADDDSYREAADVINISSLYGYKFSEKLAVSTLGEYRSTIITNFNNPGYLDIGAGVTWTPANNLVVVVHPLNYNFVFSDDEFSYESSLGAKLVADYTKEIIKGVNWKSNLSAFLSYKGSDLSNWTWVNGFGFSVWKGIGVGLELGLRKNQQEALAQGLVDENPLQTYYVIGLSYNVGSK
jgi:hypothetical protein